jgi:hypothetical protein
VLCDNATGTVTVDLHRRARPVPVRQQRKRPPLVWGRDRQSANNDQILFAHLGNVIITATDFDLR